MKKVIFIILISIIIQQVLSADPFYLCKDQERTIEEKDCQKAAQHVCAFKRFGTLVILPEDLTSTSSSPKTKLNRCLACSDNDISFILPESCESFFPNVIFCNPDQETRRDISNLSNNIWGVDYNREGQNYTNNWLACSQKDVMYYYPPDI